MWTKQQKDEKAQMAFPFPLKVGQKWEHSDGGAISLVGIRDFEAVDRTYEDCLVFEAEGEENNQKTKSEFWYAPDIGLLFSKKKGSEFLTTMHRMSEGEKTSGSENQE